MEKKSMLQYYLANPLDPIKLYTPNFYFYSSVEQCQEQAKLLLAQKLMQLKQTPQEELRKPKKFKLVLNGIISCINEQIEFMETESSFLRQLDTIEICSALLDILQKTHFYSTKCVPEDSYTKPSHVYSAIADVLTKQTYCNVKYQEFPFFADIYTKNPLSPSSKTEETPAKDNTSYLFDEEIPF